MEATGTIDNRLELWLGVGLVLDAILIIMSVDQMFNNHEYLQLIITSILFACIVLTIRWLNGKQ